MHRYFPFETGDVHHVMNKSIEGYEIFPRPEDYERFLRLIRFFSLADPPTKFSLFLERHPEVQREGFESTVSKFAREDGLSVQIIAYCVMPTHFHLLVRQLEHGGISELLRQALMSYARYFNTKYGRRGVLWMGKSKNVLVESDEQLIHVVRYIHLNPVTAYLVKRAESWPHSSYREYVEPHTISHPVSDYSDLIDMTPSEHKVFCEDHSDYQRSLASIKKLALE